MDAGAVPTTPHRGSNGATSPAKDDPGTDGEGPLVPAVHGLISSHRTCGGPAPDRAATSTRFRRCRTQRLHKSQWTTTILFRENISESPELEREGRVVIGYLELFVARRLQPLGRHLRANYQIAQNRLPDGVVPDSKDRFAWRLTESEPGVRAITAPSHQAFKWGHKQDGTAVSIFTGGPHVKTNVRCS